ncbi:MAG: HRDC domain-containing protein [Planctomycetota bacterium]|nr:HRDC domain-containing protein [Planctomycetota bacterium]MDA1106247.1 HRDC domain-containing protein [Planctomycetota bacterium]
MNYRRRKRAIHHAEAHADETPPARTLRRDGVPQGPAEILRSAGDLDSFANHVRAAGSFAYDTEFIGEETFYPQICLVQVATSDRVALIDPFELKDLGPIWELVVSPDIECIVHAGGQDIVTAQRVSGRTAQNVIDTQIAAGLLNMPWPTSLANAIHAVTDHRIAKGHTFTEWDKRPLSPNQLAYAADDVRYLPLVWSILKSKLEHRGRLPWALHECASAIVSNDDFDPEGQVRRACRGLTMRPRTMTILRELVVTRHQLARHADKPPRALIPDAVMLDLARSKPTAAAALFEIRGMPRPVASAHAADLLAAVKRGVDAPNAKDDVWSGAKEDAGERMAIDALWSIVTMKCIAEGMAPSMIISRSDLSRWYMQRRKGSEDPLFAATNWRSTALGQWLTSFLDGSARFEIGWKGDGPAT